MAGSSSFSFQSFVGFIANNFVILVLAALFAVGGFVGGSLYTENRMLRSGTAGTGTAAANPTAAAPEAAGDQGPTADQMAQLPKVTDDDYIRGDKDAKVVLVEYSDYECPFCQRFHPTMQQVMKEYGNKVAWVFRHYPLPFHPNAQKAAEAAECVAAQKGSEGFWAYSDAVFVKNGELGGQLNPEAIKASAETTGIDMAKYQECLDSGDMANAVNSDMTAGSNAGISGTPGTYIVVDGEPKELIPGALPYEQVKPMIDQYL